MLALNSKDMSNIFFFATFCKNLCLFNYDASPKSMSNMQQQNESHVCPDQSNRHDTKVVGNKQVEILIYVFQPWLFFSLKISSRISSEFYKFCTFACKLLPIHLNFCTFLVLPFHHSAFTLYFIFALSILKIQLTKILYQVLLGVYLCQRWTVELKGITQPVLFMIFFDDFVTPQNMSEGCWLFTSKMAVHSLGNRDYTSR